MRGAYLADCPSRKAAKGRKQPFTEANRAAQQIQPRRRFCSTVFKTVVQAPYPCGVRGEIDSKTKTKRHGYRPHTARVAVSVLESIFQAVGKALSLMAMSHISYTIAENLEPAP